MKLLFFLLFFTATLANGEIYRWSDRGGVVHFSNSVDDIPERYKARAKSMNYGSEQKGEPLPGHNQTATPAAPAAEPQAKQANAPVTEQHGKDARRRAGRVNRHVKAENGNDE